MISLLKSTILREWTMMKELTIFGMLMLTTKLLIGKKLYSQSKCLFGMKLSLWLLSMSHKLKALVKFTETEVETLLKKSFQSIMPILTRIFKSLKLSLLNSSEKQSSQLMFMTDGFMTLT